MNINKLGNPIEITLPCYWLFEREYINKIKI